MKQWWILLIMVSFLAGSLNLPAKDNNRLKLNAGIGLFQVKDNNFKTLYNTGSLIYQFGLAFQMDVFEVFLQTDIRSYKGETTDLGDEAKFTMLPAQFGLRVFFGKKNILPYIGGSAGYYMFKEQLTIDSLTIEAKGKKFGFAPEIGLQLFFGKSFFVDFKGKYLILKVSPDEISITDGLVYENESDLSGFGTSLGVGYSF
jgi:outer membrane protein W